MGTVDHGLQLLLSTTTVNDTDGVDDELPLYPKELEPVVGPLNVRLSDFQHLLLGIYLSLVGMTATVFNVAVIVVLLKKRTFQKKSINILLLNIAFSDLAISFCGYPLQIAANYAGRWVTGVAGCKLSGFMVYFFSCVTIGTYAYIACYRYIYVCKPNKKPRLRPRFTGAILLFNWILSFLWTAAPLFGWSRYILEPFGTSCSIDWSTLDIGNTIYQVLSCVIFYFLPLGAILWSYGSIMKYSKGVDPHKAQSTDAVALPPKRNLFFKLRNKESQIDLHVTKTCALMTMVFLTAWTPYCVECLWAMHQTEISVMASVLPTMCCKASPMLNPLVLIFSSSDFREDFRKMCPCLFTRRKTAVTVMSIHRAELRDDGHHSSVSSTYYIRECDGLGKQEDAAAVYYNKERVFLGHVKTESIEAESAILKKDYTQRQHSHLAIDTADIDTDEFKDKEKAGPRPKYCERNVKRGGKVRSKICVNPRVEPEIESRPSSC